MGTVLGLSLTAEDVVWVLVDSTDRTVVDHDALEFPADAETAGAAARGAHAIAAGDGLDVDRVRLTWSDDVAPEVLRVITRLRCLGFDHVEAVPLASVLSVPVAACHSDMAPRLALAYGAALADVALDEAITVPVDQQIPARRRGARRTVASAVFGAAAAAVLAAVFLTTASVPQVEPVAATVEQSGADSGWVSVTAPTNATADRKVVATPAEVDRPVTRAVQSYVPAAVAVAEPAAVEVPVVAAAPEQAVAPVTDPVIAAAPAPVALVAAEPSQPPVEQPHLPDTAQHLAAQEPAAGPVAEVAPSAQSELEMTLPPNVFTALP